LVKENRFRLDFSTLADLAFPMAPDRLFDYAASAHSRLPQTPLTMSLVRFDSFALGPWHEWPGGSTWVQAGDLVGVQQRLGACCGNDAEMAALRRAAMGLADGCELAGLNDQQLLEHLLAPVADGWLRVGDSAQGLKLFGLATRLAPAAAIAPSASSSSFSPSKAAAGRPSPAADPAPASAPQSSFNANLDVAAMVDTLLAAAKDGVAFCEECARAEAQGENAAVANA
jgi:hypothetical protein